jgi:hypothetical protein
MRKLLILSTLIAITTGANAADSPVRMQSLLDAGYKIVAANTGRLVLENGSKVFSCGPDAGAPQTVVSGASIITEYMCVVLH